jgi:hypothetical protein
MPSFGQGLFADRWLGPDGRFVGMALPLLDGERNGHLPEISTYMHTEDESGREREFD